MNVGLRIKAVLVLITLLCAGASFAAPAFANPTYSVFNAEGGIYWRSAPDWNTAEKFSGFGVYNNEIIEPHCYQAGAANVPGSADGMWEYATDVNGPGHGTGWVNEHFINDGQPINSPSPGVPPCNPPAPSVGTGGAGAVSQTSAELTGSVNPNWGNVTDCHFDYGTTTGYGSSVGCSPGPGGGTSWVGVAASIGGLSPRTTYHFRIAATNAGGTNYGGDSSFTTLPNPPAVVTGVASPVTPTAATLNGSVNPEGGTVSDCHVDYGTTPSFGSSAPCVSLPGSGISPVTISSAVSGLAGNTTYYFRVVSTNPGGTTYGTQQSFKTAYSPPAVVAGEPSAVARSSAGLNGTVNPEGSSVTDCHFDYGTTTAYGSSAPCSATPGSGTSPVNVAAAITGLTLNTRYYFRLVATNSGGTASTTTESSFLTLPNPPAVVTVGAGAVTQTTSELEGVVNPESVALADCHFDYGTTTAYGASAACASLPGAGSAPVAVAAALGSLTPNTTYYLRLVATSSGGTSYGTASSFTTLPNPPTVVAGPASSITPHGATLNATVNPEGGAVSDCHVDYGTTPAYGSSTPCTALPGAGTSPVAVVAQASGLAPNTTYDFRVVATNIGGTTNGAQQSFKTPYNPPAVAATAASEVGETSLVLNGSVDPEGSLVSDCHFDYGPTPSFGSSVPCATSPGAGSAPVAVSGSLSGLTPGAVYYYRVVATNEGGTTTGASAEAAAATPTLPELGRCIKLTKPEGEYKTASCTTKSIVPNTGGYAWVPWPFAGSGFERANGIATLTVTASTAIKCSGNSIRGAYSGFQQATLSLVLTGCEGSGTLPGKCESEGDHEGEISSSPLSAHLGIIVGGLKPTAGWEVKPTSGSALLSFHCGSKGVTISGGAIAAVTALNKMGALFTWKFKSSSGKQSPERLEGGPVAGLSVQVGATTESVRLTMTDIVSGEELVEIKALP